MQVRLLGEPCVLVQGQWHRFLPDRRYQFLSYLAYTGEWLSREKLADVFWSNLTQQAARANLRKIFFKLKSLEWLSDFEHDEQAARWQSETDSTAFQKAIAQKEWKQALELYKGQFLQGFTADDSSEFNLWVEDERARLEKLYQGAVASYVAILEQKGDFEGALAVTQKALDQDPLNETLYQMVMKLEWKRGNSEAALEQFEHCRQILKKELCVEPLPETLELLQTIEQGGLARAKYALLLKRPETVPEGPAMLFGRERLLEETLARLQKGEHLLLHGFGGMGKTALAATIAKRWLETSHNPILWLQVGSENPEALFDALARPFDAQQDLAQAEDKAKALHNILQKQHLSFLVLDDVWNAYSLSKVLEAVPAQLPVLVTSRQRYPKLTKLHIDKLERPASIELLKHYANLSSSQSQKFEALCELLGDHAFALRLAGLALRQENTTIEGLLERIHKAPHDLKIPSELKHEGRESVASLLNVSLEPLNDQAYEAFLTYGVLPTTSSTPELLARCARRDVSEMENALFTLVQRGLAERVSRPGSDLVSYRIHDLAHSYAKANRLQRTKTFIQATLEFLQHHKDDLDVLDAEIGNVLAATQVAKDQKREADFVKFMHLLTVEGTYYMARGHTARSVELLKIAADVAEQSDEQEEAHYLLGKLGDYYINFIGDNQKAVEYYQKALELAQNVGNQGREAVYHGVIAVAHFYQKSEGVDKELEEAYQLGKKSGDDYCLYIVIGQRALVATLEGDQEKANRLLRESLELIDQLEKTKAIKQSEVDRSRFFTLLNFGETEYKLGHFEKAIEVRQTALDIAQRCNNNIWTAFANYDLGNTYHHAGRRDLAQENMEQALKLFEANNAWKDVEATLSFLKDEGYWAA